MIDWHATVRRGGVIAVAVSLALWLLRPQVSSALVTRGDDLTFRGENARALAIYARALAIDPANTVAADRFAFAALLSHDASAQERGVSVATRALRLEPSNLSLRYDRALCAQALGWHALAADDFEAIGRRSRDPRALLFAALDVRKADLRRARSLLRLALAIAPSFEPARRDLYRIKP
jgi:tetratricopeptide (TPR) repeat protein